MANYMFLGFAPIVGEDLTGQVLFGNVGKFFEKMIIDSGIKLNDYFFIYSMLCTPRTDNINLLKNYILQCRKNIDKIINFIKPKYLILVGSEVEEYYKKYFPKMGKINHPFYLLKQGGERSPYYLTNIQRLKGLKYEN